MQAVTAVSATCKCCGKLSPIYGVCDFNKSCEEGRGTFLPKSGLPIYYYRCEACNFLFSTAYDDFSDDDFSRVIYNDDYIKVDPDYVSARPTAKATLTATLLGPENCDISILDYGSGAGVFEKTLRGKGFSNVQSYDPYGGEHTALPKGKFRLITCFEVFEHAVDPRHTLESIVALMGDDAGLLFSTRIQPEEPDNPGLDWWYVGPRNGHVSIHTRNSLKILLEASGLKFVSLGDNLHFAYRQFPAFASQFGCIF